MALDLDQLVNSVAADPVHFAVPVTYTPSGGSAVTVNGIFDEAFEEIAEKDGAAVTTIHPALGVQLSQFPAGVVPAQGDAITIAGTLYTVVDMRPDGLGWAQLMLMLAA